MAVNEALIYNRQSVGAIANAGVLSSLGYTMSGRPRMPFRNYCQQCNYGIRTRIAFIRIMKTTKAAGPNSIDRRIASIH